MSAADDTREDQGATLAIPRDDTLPHSSCGDGASALPLRDPGRYRRIAEVARGGMGRIVAAHDQELGREVAIKELLTAAPVLERRFVREVQLTMRMQHPSIIAVLDAGCWPDGAAFYTMPRVEGRTLKDVIAGTEPLDQRIALVPHVLAVADALGHAHRRSVIHRDLKPANVLIGAFGETIVIDWGLGKDLGDATADEPDQGVATEAEMTVRGRALGTPAYMSPEQARGEPVDARADVYAIGAMLYHVLARRPPHDDPTQAADVERGLARPPRPLDDIAPGAPTDLLAIVAKAMAPDPVARYPTAVELAGDLRRFSSGRLVAAHRYSPRQLLGRWIARHRAAVAVAGVAAVVLAVVAAVAIQGIREQRDLAAWQRAVAEQHRAQVEGLFDFMLVDLHEKLQPIGKLELLALVVDRADAYYRNRSVDLAGDEVRRRALTRLHLGDIRVAMGDLPGGLTAYRDALALFARAGDVSSIAGCDDKIGTVLAKQGDLTGGLAAVRQSLAIRRRRADETPDDRDRQRELAAAYVHLGELSFAQEDVASALSSYRESLAISQQLANREPADAEEQRRVARAHGKVGYALYAQLDLPGALAEYRSELAILEAVAARDPANTTLRYNLSGAMDDVADILREQKDLVGALALYRASLAIARRLGEHDPANTEWQRGVSIGEVNVGTTLRDLGDLRGALSSYQAAYSIRARLAAQDPTNADWQYELSIGAERIGNTQRSLGDLAAALAAYRESMAIRERLAARDPTNPTSARNLFIAHYKIGTIAEAQGDAAAARRSYQIGLDGLDRLAAEHPDDASLRSDADELRAWLAGCCDRRR